MESGLECVPEIIECSGYRSGSWPNISGAKLTGTGDPGPFASKTYMLIKSAATHSTICGTRKLRFVLKSMGDNLSTLIGSRLSKLQRRNELLVINSCAEDTRIKILLLFINMLYMLQIILEIR
jgi:hypothetical protein